MMGREKGRLTCIVAASRQEVCSTGEADGPVDGDADGRIGTAARQRSRLTR